MHQVHPREDCLVLVSNLIFNGEGAPFKGFVAIQQNRIAAVGTSSEAAPWLAKATRVIELENRVLCPGFCDTHTFFSGWALLSTGVNFSRVVSDEEGVQAIRQWQAQNPGLSFVIGHSWQPEHFTQTRQNLLDEAFAQTPVVIFNEGRDNCWMNAAARQKYQFTPEACYAEMIWRMMPDYLNMPGMAEKYLEYNQMLNSRGVTTIKEMTFDDYYGFADVMEALEKEEKLTVRVSMMSQPVGQGINIAHGKAMQKRFTGSFVSFSGYNRMTDRGIGRYLGELIEPYKSRPDIRVEVPVEWDLIEQETRLADENGFRFSLHCQGDGAFRHTVDLFGSCKKENGRLVNRHAITDLELTDPADIDRFGEMGGIAEVYAQIQSLDVKQDIVDMIDEKLGAQRGQYYWNRRRMWDAGVCVSCGTDLPLLIPNIPEAIYCGCGGNFAEGGSMNESNMLTIAEMLQAWTKNGQYNCMNENRLGTLQEGMLADIAVLDADVFTTPISKMRDVNVCLTISDGRIVYNTLPL